MNVVGGPPCQEPTARAKGDSIPSPRHSVGGACFHRPNRLRPQPTQRHGIGERVSRPYSGHGKKLSAWAVQWETAKNRPLILKAVIPPSGTAPEVIVPLHACNVPTAGPSRAPTLSAANHPLTFGTTGSQSRRNGGSGATNLQTVPVSTSRNQRPP